jgi:hypothetical protein
MSSWRSVYASVKGTSHIELNQPCQDACRCESILTPQGKEFLVMIASDGAGSAPLSDEGSKMVCQLFFEKLSQFLIRKKERKLNQITEKRARRLLRYVSDKIGHEARTRTITKRDFAATLVMVVVGNEDAVFLQLGDGAIVIDSDNAYHHIFWPQSGEYANQTYFVTDTSAAQNLNFAFVDKKINEVALFTDGIQGLALKYDIQNAHTPFFKPLFTYLQSASEEVMPQLNDQMEAFLNSEAVNAKTNDDKTLILACRCLKSNTASEDLSVIEA